MYMNVFALYVREDGKLKRSKIVSSEKFATEPENNVSCFVQTEIVHLVIISTICFIYCVPENRVIFSLLKVFNKFV